MAANTWGEEGQVAFSGESAILGPDGAVLASGPTRGDAVLLADAPGLGAP